MDTIDQTKLAAVKTALKLTIELREKANVECSIEKYQPSVVFGLNNGCTGIEFDSVDVAAYIAHACNVSGDRDKALLLAIEGLENILSYQVHNDAKRIAMNLLSSILATFTDEAK